MQDQANVASGIGLVIRQKHAEDHIHHLQKIQDRILQSTQEGIYGLDGQGTTTFVNKAAIRLLGWGENELIGRCQHELIHHTKPNGSPYPQEECPIHGALREGKVHHVTNEVFWRKDGTSFPVEYTSSPLRNDEGKLLGAVVEFREIRTQDRAGEKSGRG